MYSERLADSQNLECPLLAPFGLLRDLPKCPLRSHRFIGAKSKLYGLYLLAGGIARGKGRGMEVQRDLLGRLGRPLMPQNDLVTRVHFLSQEQLL